MANEVKTVPQILRALDERGYETRDLGPVGVRPRLSSYVADLWDRRHFIWMDSRHRVGTLHSRNRLGNLWLVMRPVLDSLLYFVIFGLILKVQGDVENFAAYVVIGVLMFQATSRSISQGPNILRSGRSMIRAFSFPRASLPLSSELRDSIQMVYTLSVVLIMIMVISPHEWPTLTWLLVAPIYGLQFVMNLGISFLVSRIGFMLPDVSQFMTVVSRFLMYGSGVIFPIDHYLDHPLLNTIVQSNPVYQMLHMYRQVLMDGTMPTAHSWLVLGAWAAGLLMVGFIFFWRGEATYGDDR